MSSKFTLRLYGDTGVRLEKYCDERSIVKNGLINKLIKEFLDNIEQNKNRTEDLKCQQK